LKCTGPVDATVAAIITQAALLCEDLRLNTHKPARLQVVSAIGYHAAGSADADERRQHVELLMLQAPAGVLPPDGHV
jgi:hypothetical protein